MKKKVDPYLQGQADLIKHIQAELTKSLDRAKGVDLMLDIISLLKDLRPLQKKEDE